LTSGVAVAKSYDLVLIDEYQDFNRLEAGLIDILGESNPIVIAGDDDQALYSRLRSASWDHIRMLSKAGEYEVFELPFCLRCPKVVVDAVRDILAKAQELHRLEERIDKPFKHFPPIKGANSAKYPKIALVETSVQRQSANYMGRYIAQAIARIPSDEIEMAVDNGYPAALVIASNPYRNQIIEYLQKEGFVVDTRREPESKLNREMGISILKEDQNSNLGWRIILHTEHPPFLAEVIRKTTDYKTQLVDVISDEFRKEVLAEVSAYEPAEEMEENHRAESTSELPSVKVTSFEGAKGLSAQHVFMVGLHDGEFPHDPMAIQDLEICKFVVGLTRTRKMCSLIYTKNFAGKWKTRSSFISWIDRKRLDYIKVDAAFWKKRCKD
jgi:superfamily I DNA/RNA helicase